jgi:hypothetical protein
VRRAPTEHAVGAFGQHAREAEIVHAARDGVGEDQLGVPEDSRPHAEQRLDLRGVKLHLFVELVAGAEE